MDWVLSTSPILIEVRGENAVPNVSATGVPTISGTAKEGSTLTAGTSGIADGNGLGTLKYQWVRVTGTVQTDIDGATASTYTLTEEDLDRTIIVRVSFIDQDGHPEGPLSSAATGVVTAPNLLVKNTLAGVNAIPTASLGSQNRPGIHHGLQPGRLPAELPGIPAPRRSRPGQRRERP